MTKYRIRLSCATMCVALSLFVMPAIAAEKNTKGCIVSERFYLKDYIAGNGAIKKKEIPKDFVVIKRNVKMRTNDNVGQYSLPAESMRPGSYLRWNSHDIAECVVRDDHGKVWFVQKSKDGIPFYMPQDQGIKEE